MTDFDTTLRDRMARLDAAIPNFAEPEMSAARRGPNRRRQGVILIAAAASLLAVTALAAVANQPPPDPAIVAQNEADERRVLDDLGAHTANACLSLDEAIALFRARLDALGLADWTIRDDGRATSSPCVGAAVIGDAHEVLIMPSMGMPVATALDALGAELLATCAGREEAVERLRATLVAEGIAEPRIEVTGIRAVPIDKADAYVRHVENGCHVYGGAQFDSVGSYTWFISGQ